MFEATKLQAFKTRNAQSSIRQPALQPDMSKSSVYRGCSLSATQASIREFYILHILTEKLTQYMCCQIWLVIIISMQVVSRLIMRKSFPLRQNIPLLHASIYTIKNHMALIIRQIRQSIICFRSSTHLKSQQRPNVFYLRNVTLYPFPECNSDLTSESKRKNIDDRKRLRKTKLIKFHTIFT